jgi:uncharacterized protein with HEPN domain
VSEGGPETYPERSWLFFLDDMIAFARDALDYTAGLDQAAFERNGLVFDATLRKLELIGEAARNVPEEIRQLAPRIPGARSLRRVTVSFMPIWASTATRSGASSTTTCPR